MTTCSICGKDFASPPGEGGDGKPRMCPQCRNAERDFDVTLRRLTPRIFIVPLLAAVNVGLYLLMAYSVSPHLPGAQDLVYWGANFGPLTIGGQWWRLLTATFAHASPAHLIMNMTVLWSLGRTAERMYGHITFLIIYLLSGLGGSLLSLVVHRHSVSVGASGAVFGIAGASIVFLAFSSTPGTPAYLRRRFAALALFAGYSLFAGFTAEGIDNAGHVGGLFTGFLSGGFVLGRRYGEGGKTPVVMAGALAAVVIGAVLSTVFQGSCGPGGYRQLVESTMPDPMVRTPSPEELRERVAWLTDAMVLKPVLDPNITRDPLTRNHVARIMDTMWLHRVKSLGGEITVLDVADSRGIIRHSINRGNIGRLFSEMRGECAVDQVIAHSPVRRGGRHGSCTCQRVGNGEKCHGCHDPDREVLGFVYVCMLAPP